jgi:hypothetical protein
MFYIASPYTSPDPFIREERYREVMRFTAWWLKTKGSIPTPFSPILYLHEMNKTYSLPLDFQFWLSFNHNIISYCSAIMVLQLPGWDASSGVRDEIMLGNALRKPIWRATPHEESYILEF